jgi:hypothetical protein
MKYLKTYKLFEAVDINISDEDYIGLLCDKAKVVFSEDEDWKQLKTRDDIVEAFDIDSYSELSLDTMFGDYRDRVLALYKRDLRKYISKISVGRGGINPSDLLKLKKHIAKFPGFRVDDVCEIHTFPEINDLFRKNDRGIIPFITSYAVVEKLNEWIPSIVSTSDIFLEKFTEYYLDGVIDNVKKIIEENPSYLKDLKEMEFMISSYIQDELFKRLKSEKWLKRGDETGLFDFKNQ